MGVDRTDYLMFGVKLDADLFSWDTMEKEVDGAPGSLFDIVYDGMSGKYMVAGKIIARSDPYEGLDFKEITDSDLPKDVAALAGLVSEKIGAPVLAQEFRLYLFSHFH